MYLLSFKAIVFWKRTVTAQMQIFFLPNEKFYF